MVCMNSYSIFVKVVLDDLKVQTTSPFECQYSASQNYCTNSDTSFEINTFVKRHVSQAWSCRGETGIQD